MQKINIAVCDDDKQALNSISGAIYGVFRANGYTITIDTFPSADELNKVIAKTHYDLVFLDIDMPGTDGINYGKRMRELEYCPEIIYVSNLEDRVFESLSVQPFGFIRKSNFIKDVNDVVNLFISSHNFVKNKKKIILNTHGAEINVYIKDIIYFEGSGVYQQMYLNNNDKPTEINSRMEKLENELTDFGFMRIHKGFLVNYIYISRICTNNVYLDNGKMLPISRRKSNEIKSQYLSYSRKYGDLIF